MLRTIRPKGKRTNNGYTTIPPCQRHDLQILDPAKRCITATYKTESDQGLAHRGILCNQQSVNSTNGCLTCAVPTFGAQAINRPISTIPPPTSCFQCFNLTGECLSRHRDTFASESGYRLASPFPCTESKIPSTSTNCREHGCRPVAPPVYNSQIWNPCMSYGAAGTSQGAAINSAEFVNKPVRPVQNQQRSNPVCRYIAPATSTNITESSFARPHITYVDVTTRYAIMHPRQACAGINTTPVVVNREVPPRDARSIIIHPRLPCTIANANTDVITVQPRLRMYACPGSQTVPIEAVSESIGTKDHVGRTKPQSEDFRPGSRVIRPTPASGNAEPDHAIAHQRLSFPNTNNMTRILYHETPNVDADITSKSIHIKSPSSDVGSKSDQRSPCTDAGEIPVIGQPKALCTAANSNSGTVRPRPSGISINTESLTDSQDTQRRANSAHSKSKSTRAPSMDVIEPTIAPSMDVIEPTKAPSMGVIEPTIAPSMDVIEPTKAPSIDVIEPTIAPSMDVIEPTIAPCMDVIETTKAPSMDVIEMDHTYVKQVFYWEMTIKVGKKLLTRKRNWDPAKAEQGPRDDILPTAGGDPISQSSFDWTSKKFYSVLSPEEMYAERQVKGSDLISNELQATGQSELYSTDSNRTSTARSKESNVTGLPQPNLDT